jgi:teichoic acid transport system permease protein
MLNIKTILKEVLGHLQLTWTVARYNNKAAFQGHYFGMAWEVLDPLIQIGIYYFMFGAMREMRGVKVGHIEVPFFSWMVIGMAAWMFMSRVTLIGSQSVQKKIGLVSKMQFPMSVLPAMTVASRITSYIVTTIATLIIILSAGFTPNIFWIQYIYYVLAMFVFLYFFSLLNSTLTIMFPDYIQVLRPVMRFMMFFSGVIWRLNEMPFPNWFVQLMDLNPFSYIITGFRYTFFGQAFFWQHWETTAFFWLLVLLIAIVASHLHLKLRAKFIDLA